MPHPLPSLTIAPEPLNSPAVRALIARLDAELSERYPDPADNHFELTAEEVSDSEGVFLVARLDGEPVACGALRRLEPQTGEIKRMYVAVSERGMGIGRRVLAALERHASALRIRRLVLETGERQPEAIALYERAGFRRIDRFGAYVNSPASVCMGKDLAPERHRPSQPSNE
jgi:putative acetyltransferase